MNRILKTFIVGIGLFLGSFLAAHAAMKYLTPAGDSEGYSFGTASTDKISFYGATPAAKTSVATKQNYEMYVTTAVLTPGAVDAGGALGGGFRTAQFNVPGITSGYPVIVTKPTVQTGLFLSGYGSSANGATINFLNSSWSTLTPTASETYTFTQMIPSSAGAVALGNTLGLW